MSTDMWTIEPCRSCGKVSYLSPREPWRRHPSGTVDAPSGRVWTFDVYECPLGNGWHVKLDREVRR